MWSPLTCPAISCSKDLPNVFRSLGTSFSSFGSHLFGIWNVLFWFWVKPQEKGFYFWNAHFQLYIPLDGIRFSGIGVCTNGILSHVSNLAMETCCFVWERMMVWSVNISCPSQAVCFGYVRKKEIVSKNIRDPKSGLSDLSLNRNQMVVTSSVLKTLCEWSYLFSL